MLEKVFGVMPDWLKSKLVIRMVYTASSFITARIVAFLTGDYLQKIAGEIVQQAGHVGIILQLKVVSVDQRVLEGFITGLLMVAAEFVLEHVHSSYVLPAVQATQEPTQGGQK